MKLIKQAIPPKYPLNFRDIFVTTISAANCTSFCFLCFQHLLRLSANVKPHFSQGINHHGWAIPFSLITSWPVYLVENGRRPSQIQLPNLNKIVLWDFLKQSSPTLLDLRTGGGGEGMVPREWQTSVESVRTRSHAACASVDAHARACLPLPWSGFERLKAW